MFLTESLRRRYNFTFTTLLFHFSISWLVVHGKSKNLFRPSVCVPYSVINVKVCR